MLIIQIVKAGEKQLRNLKLKTFFKKNQAIKKKKQIA